MNIDLSSRLQFLWRWRWVLILNAYLMSPVFALELRVGEGGASKTAAFVLSASVLWLLVTQLVARRIWLAHALMFPLYLVVGGDLFVIANYHTRLDSAMILTIIENWADAWGFVESELKRIAEMLVPILVGYGYGLWRIRALRVTTPRWVALLPMAAAVGVYFVVLRYLGSWAILTANDHNSPYGIVSQAYRAGSIYKEESRQRERAKFFRFAATRPSEPAEPELYVIVIGESSRKHNWSLYGYARDTNPLLSKTENLIVFRDVITQAAKTQVSVPLMLTRGRVDDPVQAADETSIVSLYHQVGFRTYWLSTQERATAMASISRYANEADTVRFFEHRHDIVLVNSMKELLSSHADKKAFFLLHTLGSHFNLVSRYPPEFAVFPDGHRSVLFGGTSAALTHTELIGAYDNTIRYTDYVLAELIDLLRQRPGIKAMLYLSDHGDNLRDDERDLFGHAHSNEYDLPIPMLLWYSDEYAEHFPAKIECARTNASRPMNTRVVFYSLADMPGIVLEDPELGHLSVFSNQMENIKRITFGYPKPFDFDEWLARTGTKIPVVTPPN